jgi:hypothetical protein
MNLRKETLSNFLSLKNLNPYLYLQISHFANSGFIFDLINHFFKQF